MIEKIIFEHWRYDEHGCQRRYRRNFHPFKPQTKGGRTYCKILLSDEQFVGWAFCSDKDNYNYKLGRDIAFGRAKKSLLMVHPEYHYVGQYLKNT